MRGEQLMIPEMQELRSFGEELTDEQLFEKLDHGIAALDEIHDSLSNPDGMTAETRAELYASWSAINVEIEALGAQAEKRNIMNNEGGL